MQGNGFKIGLLAFFFALSAWYLYPTVRNYFIQQRISGLEEQERVEYERENLQTIRTVKEDALKLGLDLQGGMHVTMEVRTDALIRELATDVDQTFEEVLAAARVSSDETGNSIIDAFVMEFERRDPDARLSRYFRDADAGITRRSTNAEVSQYLLDQADNAINRAISIIRDRVDRYGVTEPSIQKQGTRRVVVELPGIDDPERVRNLLKGTARLEFHLMAEPEELLRSLERAIEHYNVVVEVTRVEDEEEDGAEADSILAAEDLFAEPEEDEPTNALLEVMQPVGQGVVFGLVSEQDTARVSELLSVPAVQEALPIGVDLLYEANPVGLTEDGLEMYYLLGVRDQIELSGEVITSARVDFDELNLPEVTMVMNSEGSRTWARLTGANVDKNIAIVLDGVVYSYPTVINRIVGGRSSITGLDSREEAQDIVTVLMSGALPAPVDIVEERTVGPSLGRASIRAGFISIMVGLGLVAIFMIFYYRTAGLVADLALLFNIIFIFGILAAFNATLTLPGIAGIVLTIGMAVDANVLIFERIREERATGKTLKAAIDAGYSKAFSAIFDANVTTFFVGAILYSFGVGPIQGFAVTLMAGILSSLFTAIIVSRIVFDYMVVKRRMSVSYG
ncbi:MAG: protein translocase subunit SecD [Bacteroidetes bacterium SB0662_bin_6]|nr:protein translocase subunit SecD [Bacteroidetes bacterium SB0668_bin_1]MYE03811.1 protein translocase subunit SecD [Bacteroidetes bacterium SB0662_bin_6]